MEHGFSYSLPKSEKSSRDKILMEKPHETFPSKEEEPSYTSCGLRPVLLKTSKATLNFQNSRKK